MLTFNQTMTTTNRHIQLAIFRLEDVCVRVQEGMNGYLRTAALAKSDQIEATFRWLRKRGVRICLLSNYSREDTEVLLNRLDWEVGEDGYIQLVVLHQQNKENPVLLATEHANLPDATRAVLIADTPRLLRCAYRMQAHFVIGVTNGSHRYESLASEPHHALLDSPLQLPNFLLRHLPGAEERRLGDWRESSELPRLGLRRSMMG